MKKKKISDYENYLLDVHAKVITPDEIVNQVVKEATGFDVFLKKRIISGEVNEVYTIESSDRSQIVVRISRGEKPNFAQEKWVINECRKIDIPVPEILLIKYIDYGKERLLFCVQRKIEGDPLERGKIDYHNLDKENLKKIIIQAGEILSKIHSINIKGFGYLNKNCIGEFKT
ncbi:MAG: phosphotransferase, partial [Patescibacteria group bacterium]|nr:phosphotransferase [Patescibacteria group bacterium]